MIQNTYKLLLAAFLAAFTFSGTKAQITFTKGYLVNEKGDTLRGEVKMNPKKEQDYYARVTFKDASGTQKNYKPSKVKAYGFDNEHFVSIVNNDEGLFYKRLTNGPIVLYKGAFEVVVMNKATWEFEYFLLKEGDNLAGGKAGKLTDVKGGKFKKQLQEWMKDGQEHAESYNDSDKKLNVESAIEVINKYNNWKKNN
ncbi:MAG: hypothetical protein SGJ15_08580 [Bacteroidota bacterium]|nr:hypothetical protein [Bacteroidota bacterium]